jgi:hypothetical protein
MFMHFNIARIGFSATHLLAVRAALGLDLPVTPQCMNI